MSLAQDWSSSKPGEPARNQDWAVVAGDGLVLNYYVVDRNGVAVDITGSTIDWGMAWRVGYPRTLTKTSGNGAELVDGPNGHFRVTLTGIDTAAQQARTYQSQARLTDANSVQRTVATGEGRVFAAI